MYAQEQGLGGFDYCGRTSWAMRVPDAGQYFPRDFNLVALSGNVTRTRDVAGAIAAAGGIGTTSFNINYEGRHEVALIAGQNIALIDGTVNGGVHYGTSLSLTRVTFPSFPAPGAPTVPPPVVFSASKDRLNAMSAALARYYPATKVSLSNGEMNFVGTDPEINVFSVAGPELQDVRSFKFSLPHGAYAIINVSGRYPIFRWAGFSGTFDPGRTLWNIPNASMMRIESVGFMGSILAPNAYATFLWGSIRGTAVVAQAEAEVEMYDDPFSIPALGGCLHRDPTWSCSEDTKIDDTGGVTNLTPEAGFLEIPTEFYTAEGQQRESPTHRMWYSFHPAKAFPATKPVAVFFNGGPGAATSVWLFAFNTGPMTLDPMRTPGVSPNDVAWDEFANLLYIDAPGTGFSYAVANSDDRKPDHGLDMDRDAAIFASTLLRFLDRHPPLQRNEVIVVAESYGGARASLMLRHVYDYMTLTDNVSAYQDAQLSADVLDYFWDVFLTPSPDASQIASKLGHQVLLEPLLVGTFQYEIQRAFFPDPVECAPGCPSASSCDDYDCDLYLTDPMGTIAQRDDVAARLNTVENLTTALKVNPRTIQWMYATERGKAYGKGANGFSSADMTSVFGDFSDPIAPLYNPDDNYFVSLNQDPVRILYGDGTGQVAMDWNSKVGGAHVATAFARNVIDGVRTFISVGRRDLAIRSNAIPTALKHLRAAPEGAEFASLVNEVLYDDAFNWTFSDEPFARPGAMQFELSSGSWSLLVVMPHMYEAGHMIEMGAPAELREDVMTWYFQSTQ